MKYGYVNCGSMPMHGKMMCRLYRMSNRNKAKYNAYMYECTRDERRESYEGDTESAAFLFFISVSSRS